MIDARTILEQHAVTLSALQRGGLKRGVGRAPDSADDLLDSIQGHWEMEQRLIKRVLRESGDVEVQLATMRSRTEGFIDKYPERRGWQDQEGTFWDAQRVLDAIDKLTEEIETRQAEDESFDDFDEAYFEE
ncbi:MAG: hypothetical protein KDD73_04950 [Anaerolineales bacterium]|nr:hypothetical protein [Anaerolineales bacterium]